MRRRRIKRALLYLQRIVPREEKPDPVSSLRICWYLLDRLEFDAVWHTFDPAPDPLPAIDELWFVASSWAFLDDAFRQQTLKVFPLADRVVWCNNDRNVPWHSYHLGRCRPDAHLAVLTTVSEIAHRFGCYGVFDWNRLTYDGSMLRDWEDRLERFYYYGSVRPDRLRTFDRYLPWLGPRLTLAAANGKARKWFEARYPGVAVVERAPDVFEALGKHAATPVLEDAYSLTHHVCPPNRFYEALSAGTAMFFEPEAVAQWSNYGFDVSPFLIDPAASPDAMLDRAKRVARRQEKWHRNYWADMNREFAAWLKKIRSGRTGIIGPPEGAKRYL